MPYLTEELFQRLPHRGDNWPESVCIAKYPKPDDVSILATMSSDMRRPVFRVTDKVRNKPGCTVTEDG